MQETGKHTVVVCVGSTCYSKGNKQLLEIIEDYVIRNNLSLQVNIQTHHCFNNCDKAPNIEIDGKIHGNLTEQSVLKLLGSIMNE
jgi:NADH:ubiquinone oxidoreductase subunit E